MFKNVDAWMKPKTAKTPIHLQPAKSFVVREPYGSVSSLVRLIIRFNSLWSRLLVRLSVGTVPL